MNLYCVVDARGDIVEYFHHKQFAIDYIYACYAEDSDTLWIEEYELKNSTMIEEQNK